MADLINQKTCRLCKQSLPLSEFERRQTSRDGFRHECRDCKNIQRWGRPRQPKNYRIVDGQQLKTCTRCRHELSAIRDNFSPQRNGAFGLMSICKPCASIVAMQSVKKHDPTFERIRKWRTDNRTLHNEYAKRARIRRKDDAPRLEKHRAYVRNRSREERKDPQVRFIQSVRAQLGMVIRGKIKGSGLLRRLGYSRQELIAHIENLFKPGMNWDNYGRGGWQLDHRRPCAAFDLSDPIQFDACWALSNLQPLWESENAAKGARLVP